MANFTKQFQEEVRRLVRKETKEDLARLRSEVIELRRTVVQLRRHIDTLNRLAHGIDGGTRHTPATAAAETNGQRDAAAGRARITSTTVRTLRQKLGLTQAELARLLGVSGQSVYQWERRTGRLQLRRATREAILEAKGLGIREARARLDQG